MNRNYYTTHSPFMKIQHPLFLFLSLLLLACSMPQEPPVFKNITQIKTSKISGSSLVFTANAVFHNPNNKGLKLKDVDIEVLINGKNVGHVSQEEKIKILPNADFVVPIHVDVDLNQLGLLNGIFGMLSGKKMQAEFVGKIKVVKNGLTINVPVRHVEALNLRL
ncbi:MAG: LEA type 2 family protein [Cyclobacteriaceae bacterium]|nr:LEA type 2 family protein [Cyclobacteriaceae bacterium]